MTRFRTGLAAALIGLAAAPAFAQAPVKLGYVPVTDYLPAYVAKEKGLFDKHKVAVELQRIPLIANIPQALHHRDHDRRPEVLSGHRQGARFASGQE